MNSKIYYIDCYQGENKEGNIGFVKLEDEKIFVMLRGIYAGSGMDCKVYAWDRKGQQTSHDSFGEKRIWTGKLSVAGGYGQREMLWYLYTLIWRKMWKKSDQAMRLCGYVRCGQV